MLYHLLVSKLKYQCDELRPGNINCVRKIMQFSRMLKSMRMAESPFLVLR